MQNPTSVDRKPRMWMPEKAMDFPSIYDLISKYHPDNHPVSREVIACIFFEETLFCNREQQTTNGKGPASGFGQIQIYDPDKIPFFESIGYNSDLKNKDKPMPFIQPSMVTANNEFSVKLTCWYFRWLVEVKGKSQRGVLMAQTGGGSNLQFVDLFLTGGQMLQKSIRSEWTRESFAIALNYARRHGDKKNSVAITGPFAHKQFWDYIIPEEYLKFGY